MADDRPHTSQTQLELYAKCPEAFRRRYIEGEKIPPGFALLKGSGYHGGVEVNMSQKIDSHRDLPVGDIVDASVAAFEARQVDGVSLTDEEASRGLRVVQSEVIDDLCDVATVHAVKQAPDYQPIMVERKVRIELPGTHDLLAVIDLGDDQDRVVDFKSSGKRKSQADADASVQLTVYAAAYQVETGRDAQELRLDTIVQTKTKTSREVVETRRGPRDFNALADRINVIRSAIEAGNFPPASGLGWWCSSKWCGYYRTCKFVNPEPYRS